MESIVAAQHQTCVNSQNCLDELQSGFRTAHSTASTLVALWDDVLAAADKRESNLITLLEMAAAFDTMDHGPRLAKDAGVSQHSSSWFSSFLTGRSQQARMGDFFVG